MGEAAAELRDELRRTQAIAAEFVGVDGELALLVAADGSRFPASKATPDWPAVGSQVWCLIVGEQRLMLAGPAPAASKWGRVISVGTGTVVVQTPPDSSDPPSTFTLPRGGTAVVGDLVQLTREHGGLVLAVFPTASGPEPEPMPAPEQPKRRIRRTAEVNAAWDGTATPQGYWLHRDQLYTRNTGGGPNYATFGYGSRVDDTVPPGARVVAAAVFLDVISTGSQHTAGTHTLTGPAGVPAPARTFAVTPRDGWHDVGLDAAQAIADGAATGLTFYGGAGTSYGALRRNPGNGRLRIEYETEA